ETKAVPAGSGSLIETLWASLGPALLAVIVYVRSWPGMTDAGPVFVTARSACGVTAVLAVDESLLGSVSAVSVVPVAVFDRPLVTPELTCSTSVKVALAPAARVPVTRVTVPLLPTNGVIVPNPGPLFRVSDTNVVPAGSGSLTETNCASLG